MNNEELNTDTHDVKKSTKSRYEEFYGKPYDEIDFSDAPKIEELYWGDSIGAEKI